MRARVVVPVVLLAGSSWASEAAACPVSNYDAGQLDEVLPPRPTIYVDLPYGPDLAAEILEHAPPDFRDEHGPIELEIRPVSVGRQVLLAITIPRDEASMSVDFHDKQFTRQHVRIDPGAPSPRSRIVGVELSDGAPLVRIALDGRGVGYWEVATDHCPPAAVLPHRRRSGASLEPRCLGAGGARVTAHYVDGTTERLRFTAPVRPGRPARVAALAAIAVALGMAIARWLWRRRPGAAVTT